MIEVKWEVFYVNHRSWLEPIEFCPIYLGIETFTGTALVFFIIALNLHSISTHNLACKTIAKNEISYYETQTMRNTSEDDSLDDEFDDDEFDEFDSNCDSIVSMECKSPEPNNNPRSIVIDYCKKKSQISVVQPIICIWLLAISMCIPLFIYGRIIPTLNRSSNDRMCGLIVMEKNTTTILQILLLKMRIIVPMFCLFLSTIYVIIKLRFTKMKTSTKALSVEKEVDDKLKLALSLSLIYVLCSMQRVYGSLWFELISRPMMEYKYAQFHKWLGVAGCLIHYASTILRPIMYSRYDTDLSVDGVSLLKTAKK